MYEEEIHFLNCFGTLDPGDLDLLPSDPQHDSSATQDGWVDQVRGG